MCTVPLRLLLYFEAQNEFRVIIINTYDTESYSVSPVARRQRVGSPVARRQTVDSPVARRQRVEEYVARSGFHWSIAEPPSTRTQQANIMNTCAGIGRPANGIQNIADSYELFITPEIITIVTIETNRRANKVIMAWSELHPNQDTPQTWRQTDNVEIKAFIGLLLLAGVHRSKNESVSELFFPFGNSIFRATMSLKRFSNLTRFCRFDNIDTRHQRMPDDKLAPIRDIWTMFVARLQICYKPGESMTIDVPIRGRCSFRKYIPSKPGKYGIKIFWCCDSSTSYPLNGEAYLGRQPSGAQANPATHGSLGIELVKGLVNPWINSGHNITMDNFSTGADFVIDMLSVRITRVGTIGTNRREVAQELKK